jgi:LacI family transcriptional regulator
MQKNATIKDIAKTLGISIATVSRALQNSPNIKPETKRLVLQMAKELNYSPNPIALSLRENKTKSIGVLVPEIGNDFFSKTIGGIEDAAHSRNYQVIICQSHEQLSLEKQQLQHMLQKRVDGIVLSVSQQTNEYEHIYELQKKEIPFVLFDRVMKEVDSNRVVADDYSGAFEGTEHLIQNGYKRIAHITMSKFLSIVQNRFGGYRDALKKHKLPINNALVKYCGYDIEANKEIIRSLFSGQQKPDAVLVVADRLARITIEVLREMKIKIPEQVGLVAFSDNALSGLLQPALTTVNQPCFEMGRQAANMLIDSIENPNRAIMSVQLKTMLTIRESSSKRRN